MSDKNPTLAYCEAMMTMRYNLACCVAVMCRPDEVPDIERYARLFRVNDRDVQGNRSPKNVPTYADLRRMMAGTLRILLEELES